MTPAINSAKQSRIIYHVHEYMHNTACESYGDEAVKNLGVSSERVFKTLVVSIDNKALVIAIIPVSTMLSIKNDVVRSTGYVLGGVSPLGQKKQLSTFIDSSASQFTTVFVSAGKRGLEIELSPRDLQQLTQAKLVGLCQ
jgi:Cys-tRNA(Pro)/Cys-tRNA(Cys) deacylase